MRTGEIVDLANERRLSAVLDFTVDGGELLILNGGSRAEEFVVVTTVDGPAPTQSRSAYCIDSGTSMQLVLPFDVTAGPSDITLRIVGGHGEMVLAPPVRAKARRLGVLRSWSTVAAAMLLILLASGRLDSPAMYASADPEPAPAEAPLIVPNISLHAPARLPNVVAASNPLRRTPLVPVRLIRPTERRVAVTAVPPPTAPRRTVSFAQPAPRMTDLRVPTTAKSGDFVPVSFGAVARQVKIVASIGPTIVSKTIIGAQHGMINIRSPKSDLDSRIMTVRAYAQNGNQTSTLQAMVVLVRP